MLIRAMLIKMQDSGPILTKQEQEMNGKTIYAFKFRTEDIGAQCTPIGRVLRYLAIDEIPTLINVLRGDITMSMLVASTHRHGKSSG
jgi:lipopolysaccharide/colanic/teichoic acid biosynthesis glycosyltransferase